MNDKDTARVWVAGMTNDPSLDDIDCERFRLLVIERILVAQLLYLCGEALEDEYAAANTRDILSSLFESALALEVIEQGAGQRAWRPQFKDFLLETLAAHRAGAKNETVLSVRS